MKSTHWCKSLDEGKHMGGHGALHQSRCRIGGAAPSGPDRVPSLLEKLA